MATTLGFVLGSAVIFLACFLASSGGIGGGGLIVPVLLLFFGYTFEYSASLSLCVVLGNTISQFLLNAKERNPIHKTKPLIWLELVLILSPAQIAGSNLGSYLAKILPTSSLYIIALLVLLGAIKLTVSKAMRKRNQELADAEFKQKAAEINVTHSPLASNTNHDFNGIETFSGGNAVFAHSNEAEHHSQLPIVWPVQVIIVIVIMWSIYLALSVSRALSEKCSDEYIILFVMSYVPLTAWIVWGIWHNRRRLLEFPVDLNPLESELHPKDSISHPLVRVEHKLFMRHYLLLPAVTFCIGIICSLLGIGGGELLAPMMLTYHVPPIITSATSATLSLLNTSALVIRALASDEFNPEAGAILFFVGLSGGYLGRRFGLYFANTYNKASVIIFALSGALCLSALYYVYKLATETFDSDLSSPCD